MRKRRPHSFDLACHRCVGTKRSFRAVMFSFTKPLSLVCMGAVSLSLMGVGRADTPAHNRARREIAAMYVKRAQAMMRKDWTAVFATEAPDYQAVTLAGISRNREQELEIMRRLALITKRLPVQSTSKVQNRIVSLTWRGPDAIIMAETTVVGLASHGARTARSEAVVTTRDYWSQSAGSWRLRQSVERAGKAWLNGQRVQ